MVIRRPTLREQALSLPNLVTSIRILAIPAVLAVMQQDSPTNAFIAAVLFGLAAGTDALDGWLARRYDQVSAIGKLLDPLADKLLVMGTLLMLIALDRVSAWLAFLILGREMFVTGLRSIAASEGLVLAAGKLGKQKTAFQMVGLWCMIVHYAYPVFWSEPASFHRIGLGLLIVSVAFSLLSAAEYARAFAQAIDKASPGRRPGASSRSTDAGAPREPQGARHPGG